MYSKRRRCTFTQSPPRTLPPWISFAQRYAVFEKSRKKKRIRNEVLIWRGDFISRNTFHRFNITRPLPRPSRSRARRVASDGYLALGFGEGDGGGFWRTGGRCLGVVVCGGVSSTVRSSSGTRQRIVSPRNRKWRSPPPPTRRTPRRTHTPRVRAWLLTNRAGRANCLATLPGVCLRYAYGCLGTTAVRGRAKSRHD